MERLLPSRLFDISPRSRAIERSASVEPRFYLGHHKTLFYGDVGGGAKSSDVASLRRTPPFQNSVITKIWNQNRWYYHSNSVVNTVDDCTHNWFREFLTHGTVWTGVCDNAEHRSQRLTVKPLKSSDWPSDPLGPSWPSFPSIPEWMEMLRKGLDPFNRPELEEPQGSAGYTRITRRELHDNHVLATKIVSNAIVGVRSSTEIPKQFRRYFRYRQNFLILTANYALPIGLVRFLLGQWCTKPFSLWLRRSCTLKTFLRKVPTLLVLRARDRLAEYNQRLYLAEQGSSTPSTLLSSDYESDGSSELD